MAGGFRSRFWKPSLDAEVSAELAFHVEMRTRELIERGWPAAAARDEALRRFGNLDDVHTRCRDIGSRRDRDMVRREYADELRQDVVFAVRQLARNPGFAAVAILTLALGIGATTAIFSVVHAVVLRPLPFADPERLVALNEEWRGRLGDVSAGNYTDTVAENTTFDTLAAIRYASFNLAEGDAPERVIGARATASFFDVFDLPPAHGRRFGAAEDQPGREQVVVLSHRLWTRRFGADRAIVGRDIRLNGTPYTVLGVMPPAFDLTAESEELWVPIAFTPERKAMHDEHSYTIYGRLKRGMSAPQVTAELDTIAAGIRKRFPRDAAELKFRVTPLMEQFVGDYRNRLFILLGAVAFVLLIGCANVANLLLARGASRARELAVRVALGAGRGRLVRQLLTESAVLSLLGAVSGLALAWWGIEALIIASPPGVPRLEQAGIDEAALGFTLAVALLSTVVFGLAPAFRAARTDVRGTLNEGGRGGTSAVRDRLRSGLIVAELALAMLLLVGAGLLIRSAIELQRVDLGFRPEGVLSARVTLPPAEYADASRVVSTFERMTAAARGVPGVQAAAAVSQAPLGGGGSSNGLVPEGRPVEMKSAIASRRLMITPEYFRTMGVPLRRGRMFDSRDRASAPKVMIISEALARTAFPGQDPIGKRIACCEPGPNNTPSWKEVIGVAGDVRSFGPSESPGPEFYLPIGQVPDAAWDWIQRTMYVAVRTSGAPDAAVMPLRQAIRSVDPTLPLYDVRTMAQRLQASIATSRFNTMLLSLLGAVGLLLSAIGIYGVIAYFVSQRTQEIGVRMALGATRRDVMLMVVRQAGVPVLAGIALGIAAALALTRVMSEQLFGVQPHDPLTFAGVSVVLCASALLASLVPARRAASVAPTEALRMT